MVPIIELRGSIPIGFLEYNLNIFEAVGVSVLGGISIVFFWINFLYFFILLLEKHIPFLHKFMLKFLHYTKKKHSSRIEKMGHIFLVILVAIPLPGSGAFTGSAIAYLFHIPKKTALLLISLGVFLSGILVGLITYFGSDFLSFIKDFYS
jgi:uncharacterized membrane protein